ncbi:MAG: MBOAT family protein [Bacteroidales bacterium]|nr:MBOAT family protein [Bacteroidales bacterium]HOY37913.1 MBOAT family protein [Bacteroidales bacterium]HQP03501.1 MBOAT family protein [Bacteroidales bacterium]
MVFSSSIFLLYFFPIFLLLYYLSDRKYKNLVALVASLIFYSWGAPLFIFVVLGSIFIDFYLIKAMHASGGKKRHWLITASVVLNIGLLVYFKYMNFFVENVNVILGALGANSLHWTKIALPIGISFFSFQKFTYGIDVYRGKHKPLDSVWDLCLYILLFPQLIAGPIVRYSEIADQLHNRHDYETVDNRLLGFYRFVIGLAKKVLIANVMGAEADRIFAMQPIDMSTGTAWIGILAYTFQIYFDFSGYSDMAIGIGRMIGFRFPENFNNPYISQNITEFWRRWHITLGRWMRDYLYIPLGGNRVNNKWRLYFNLWVVFLISGFWHGASWTFIAWGAFHGLFLILDRLFLLKLSAKIGKYPSIIFTFLVAIIGWVLFRSETLGFAFAYIGRLFAFDFSTFEYFDREFWVMLAVALIFSFLTAFRFGFNLEKKILYSEYTKSGYFIMAIVAMVLLFVCTASISASGFNPFIYFRF